MRLVILDPEVFVLVGRIFQTLPEILRITVPYKTQRLLVDSTSPCRWHFQLHVLSKHFFMDKLHVLSKHFSTWIKVIGHIFYNLS